MFCNGPKMDGGDTARLGPTTIIEMTIPRCQSSLVMTLDDTEGLAGPLYFSPLPCINFQRSYLASYALLSWLLPSNILLITKVPSIQSFKGSMQPCKSLLIASSITSRFLLNTTRQNQKCMQHRSPSHSC